MDPRNRIVDFLRRRGLLGRTFLVGGTVRDEILGLSSRDVDVAVDGDPAEVSRDFADTGGTAVALDAPRGIHRVVTKEAVFDFSRLHPDGIYADLARRDFTINAMARRPDASPSYVIDPFGGRADIGRRRLRMLNATNLKEDPLRVLRAYRFSAVLGFRIETETRRALTEYAPLLKTTAPERRTDEWRLLLGAPHSSPSIDRMADDGVLFVLWKELAPCRSLIQNAYHHLDVFDHSSATLRELEDLLAIGLPDAPEAWKAVAAYLSDEPWRSAVIKTAALIHDIGKAPAACLSPEGRMTFHRHERLGEELLIDALPRWSFSTKEGRLLRFLVRNHLGFLFLEDASRQGRLRPSTPLRWLARWGEDVHALFLLTIADRRSARGPRSAGRAERMERFCRGLIEKYHDMVKPRMSAPRLVSGHDLAKTFGLKPGPRMGMLLKRIENEILLGHITNREQALVVLGKWVNEVDSS